MAGGQNRKGYLNKTTKIALNYGLGLVITALLLWSLYGQVQSQLSHIGEQPLWPEHTWPFLLAALLLIPVNLGIEARKWQVLAGSATEINYLQSLKSVLGGIAFSIITPNRIGEYPGRILFLDKKNSTRLISISVLGGCSQLLAILLFGVLGLGYYTWAHPGLIPVLLLAGCIVLAAIVGIFYWRFEWWAPAIERIRWLRKFHLYGRVLSHFTMRQQLHILLFALLRFTVFTVQYYLMLRWMTIPLPVWSGFCLCALFFWGMAIIPSIALAELGIRSEAGLFLFSSFSVNKLGILTATTGLWFINLVIPALIGSILLLRLKLLR